jgi:hypothetical protein
LIDVNIIRPTKIPSVPHGDVQFFKDYQPYDSIVQKLEGTPSMSPSLFTNSIVEWSHSFPHLVKYIPSIGKSVEERDIPAIIITNSKIPSSKKKMIYFNGGQVSLEFTLSNL